MIKNNSEESITNQIDPIVFLMIAQSMVNNDNNAGLFLINKKSQKDYINEYHKKLDNDIKTFENDKVDIFNKIELLTISNKQISDKIKENEVKLSKLNNNFFFSFHQIKKLKYEILQDCNYYNETFEKISNMYEEILKIEECIKKTKSYYSNK